MCLEVRKDAFQIVTEACRVLVADAMDFSNDFVFIPLEGFGRVLLGCR